MTKTIRPLPAKRRKRLASAPAPNDEVVYLTGHSAVAKISQVNGITRFLLLAGVLLTARGMAAEIYFEDERSVEYQQSCYVDNVTSFCRDGLELTLPGCSVGCASGESAICSPARLDYNTCDITPSECECEGKR